MFLLLDSFLWEMGKLCFVYPYLFAWLCSCNIHRCTWGKMQKTWKLPCPAILQVFFLKAELHRIMSWDTWKWPQKFSSKSERSISPTFTLRNNKPYLHWYLPREPWENGSGCSGCLISMKIYNSQKDRKYGLKEKSRLLLI